MTDPATRLAAIKAERKALIDALEANDYVLSRAAVTLGVHETTVLRRVREHGLDGELEERNARTRDMRLRRVLPPAPHEPSRQAEHQQKNRAAGLCGCGGEPEKRADGVVYKQCRNCRERDARRPPRPRRRRIPPVTT